MVDGLNFSLVLVTRIFYKKIFAIVVSGMALSTGVSRETGVSALEPNRLPFVVDLREVKEMRHADPPVGRIPIRYLVRLSEPGHAGCARTHDKR